MQQMIYFKRDFQDSLAFKYLEKGRDQILKPTEAIIFSMRIVHIHYIIDKYIKIT